MPRPTDPEATALKQFNELPLNTRQDIAQARNIRARVREKRDSYYEESKLFKTMVYRLNKSGGLSANKIALLVGVSRDWVVRILRDRKRQ